MFNLKLKNSKIVSGALAALVLAPAIYLATTYTTMVILNDYRISDSRLVDVGLKSSAFCEVMQGKVNYVMGDYKRAFFHYHQAQQIMPKEHWITYKMISCYLSMMKKDENFFDDYFYKLNADEPYLHRANSGKFYNHLLRGKLGINILDRLIEQNDHRAMAYLLKSEELLGRREYEGAIDCATRAIELAPDNAMSYVIKGAPGAG